MRGVRPFKGIQIIRHGKDRISNRQMRNISAEFQRYIETISYILFFSLLDSSRSVSFESESETLCLQCQ